jgi:hypothetical protein
VAETNDADRVLWVEALSREQLAPVLAGEGAGEFELGGANLTFPLGEWTLASHTFDIQENGSAIISAIYERRLELDLEDVLPE